MFNTFQKLYRFFWDNVEKYGTARQEAGDSTGMRHITTFRSTTDRIPTVVP